MRTNRISQRANKLYDSLKSKAKLVQEWFFFSQALNVIFFILICSLAVFVFIFKIRVTLGEQALYYFFSSVAQSMAAIIALGGTVIIFSYSRILDTRNEFNQRVRENFHIYSIENRDKNLYEDDSRTWSDDEVLKKLEYYKDNPRLLPPSVTLANLGFLISKLKPLQKFLDEFLFISLPSISTSFALFVFSLICIPFSARMANSNIGLFVFLLTIFMIIISLHNIFNLFKNMIIPKIYNEPQHMNKSPKEK